MLSSITPAGLRRLSLVAAAGLCLTAASAGAQVFLNLDGFGIGHGSGTVHTSAGPVTDSVNISNLFFPQMDSQAASIGVSNRGFGYAQITTASEFDSGIIRLQSGIIAQGASTCDQPGAVNCGDGSGAAGITTRATFRVSEEAVLFLSGFISAASHVDPGVDGSGVSSSTSVVTVTDPAGTLFGRTVRNSEGTLTSLTIPEAGYARLFPGIDYAFTVSSSGDGQAFGLNSSADGSAYTIVAIRLFPPACPTVTAPADAVVCAGQPGATATFTAVASGALPRTVQWQRLDAGSWTDLTDGMVVDVGTVSGSTTTTLVISGPNIATNVFRTVVRNDCGTALSDPAMLTFKTQDYNQDGSADQSDVDYLVDVIAGGPNLTGIDPDLNGDGNADQADISALIDWIAGGACP